MISRVAILYLAHRKGHKDYIYIDNRHASYTILLYVMAFDIDNL